MKKNIYIVFEEEEIMAYLDESDEKILTIMILTTMLFTKKNDTIVFWRQKLFLTSLQKLVFYCITCVYLNRLDKIMIYYGTASPEKRLYRRALNKDSYFSHMEMFTMWFFRDFI